MNPALRMITLALCAMFFVSGAAGLVFETLWFQQAGLAFGNSVWASSLVLAGYMGGLAFGNSLGARFADRPANPLRVYAWLEILVGVTGVLLVLFLPSLSAILAPLRGVFEAQPLFLNGLRFTTAFVVLALPSTAMGATLPLVSRALASHDENFGRVLGVLYASNTFGAVAGVLVTEIALIEAFGIRGAAISAAGLNFLAAVMALRISPSLLAPSPMTAEATPKTVLSTDSAWALGGRRLLIAAFLAGMCLLALEVVWLRALLLFLNDTPMCFAVILAAVLVGIASGGYLGSAWFSYAPDADRFAVLVAYAAGLAGVLGFSAMPLVLENFWQLRQGPGVVIAVAVPLVLVVSIASGLLFTLLGVALKKTGGSTAATSGRLTFANTLGAAVGPLLGGFVLLPTLGVEGSLLVLCSGYGVIGLILASRPSTPPRDRYGAALLFCAGLAFFPIGMGDELVRTSARKWMGGDAEIVEVREGLTGTLIHVQHRLHGLPLSRQLATNAYSMSSTDFISRRYMQLYVYLPLALHPGMDRVLLVGYGMGNTAKAMTDTAEIDEIDIVDISQDILDLSKLVYPDSQDLPQNDPRVTVRIEDGRHFLASTEERFDLITGEPPPPIVAGVVNLYTREYFELMRSRLNPGGFVSYWLPMMNITADTGKSIIRAFCDAFPDCSLWHGAGENMMLLGTRDGVGGVDVDRFSAQFRDPEVLTQMRDAGFERPGDLVSTFVGDSVYLTALTQNVEPVTDDRPKRLRQHGDRSEKAQLLAQWRDSEAATKRFAESGFIRKFVPASIAASMAPHFEYQRQLNDLVFPGKIRRSTRLLHQMLTRTPYAVTPILMIKSDPDVQRALRDATPKARSHEELLPHVAASHLVNRDYEAALEVLRRVDDEDLPLPGLRSYVETMVARRATARQSDASRDALPDQQGPNPGPNGAAPLTILP